MNNLVTLYIQKYLLTSYVIFAFNILNAFISTHTLFNHLKSKGMAKYALIFCMDSYTRFFRAVRIVDKLKKILNNEDLLSLFAPDQTPCILFYPKTPRGIVLSPVESVGACFQARRPSLRVSEGALRWDSCGLYWKSLPPDDHQKSVLVQLEVLGCWPLSPADHMLCGRRRRLWKSKGEVVWRSDGMFLHPKPL